MNCLLRFFVSIILFIEFVVAFFDRLHLLVFSRLHERQVVLDRSEVPRMRQVVRVVEVAAAVVLAAVVVVVVGMD